MIDSKLYYLIKGKMEVYEQDDQKKNFIIKEEIKADNFFGYKGFFIDGYNAEENIRSKGIS